MFFDTTMMQAGMEGRLAGKMGFEGVWNDRLVDLLPFGPCLQCMEHQSSILTRLSREIR